MSTPLPVIDLLNNIITLNSYLRASCTVRLPASIASDPNYQTLVESFTTWQGQLWQQYYLGLVDAGITAQANEIANFYNLNIANQSDVQSDVQSVLFNSGPAVPTVVSQCDDVSNFVASGNTLVTSLDAIAQSLQNADQAQVNALLQLTQSLSDQFNAQEDELTNDAISSSFDVVATAICLAVAVGTEGEEIQPLIKSVTKIGQDVVTELVLTSSSSSTLNQLEHAWQELDQETILLAQVTLACNQLEAILGQTSVAMLALNNLQSDWSQVADTTTGSADDWSASGDDAMREWAARMIKVNFTTATQTVSTQQMAEVS